MSLSPVVIFAYNRPDHLRKTAESLALNTLAKESNLYIYIDGPKKEADIEKVGEVKYIAHHLTGFESIQIVESQVNNGLAKSVISGITEIINISGKVIVVEDDLVTSPHFLSYMNNALRFYESDRRVMSISAYNYPPSLFEIPANYHKDVFYSLRNSSWGWGTWKDRWERVDWSVADYNDFIRDGQSLRDFNRGGEDLARMLRMQQEGRINSWAIRFSYAHYKHNAYSVAPVFSYVNNIGHDGSGTHTRKSNRYANDLGLAKSEIKFEYLEPDQGVLKSFARVFRKNIFYKMVRGIYRKVMHR